MTLSTTSPTACSVGTAICCILSCCVCHQKGKPVALLSPYSAKKGSSRIGLLKGKLKFGADWWERDQAADAEIEKSFSEG